VNAIAAEPVGGRSCDARLTAEEGERDAWSRLCARLVDTAHRSCRIQENRSLEPGGRGGRSARRGGARNGSDGK
jgi:hypothetical protein